MDTPTQSDPPQDSAPNPRLAGTPDRRTKWMARWEFTRALLDLIGWIPRALWYLAISRRKHESAVAQDLQAPHVVPQTGGDDFHWESAPRIFLSCAEVSGEVHAANLARAIQRLAQEHALPAPELVGFGGKSLAAAGVEIIGDPVAEATLLASGIAKALPFYVGLIRRAARSFLGSESQTPVDLFVPVDSPALHVPMARVAKRCGVPSVHFIAPQFWGWAPWRVGRYRKNVARALTILPFEPHWYKRHGVAVTHVGHPLLDELESLPQPPAPEDPQRTAWVLLPGSRRGEIEDNLRWMLAAMEPLWQSDPKLKVYIAQSRDDHRELIESIVGQFTSNDPAKHPKPELTIGDLHGTLARCRGAFAVSGTVLTDLLVHRIPSVVIYRDPGGWKGKLQDRLLTPGLFASTNLVAGHELLPEYCFGDEGPKLQVGQDLIRMHSDATYRQHLIEGLDRVEKALGGPGACERAARAVLEALPKTPQKASKGA